MTYTDSVVYPVLTDVMDGIVILDPTDPSESAQSYMYGNIGRTEKLGSTAVAQEYVTQVYPEYSFADDEERTLALNITVPFSSTHDDEVDAIRSLARSRRVLVYRDNRGRLVSGVILDLKITDVAHGTTIAATLTASEYEGLPA